jgi:hypothetical protein
MQKNSFLLGGRGQKMPIFGGISHFTIIKSLIKAYNYPIFTLIFIELLNL